ncbi:hypothetical protein GGTG_08470 [Gaeumannomyces tritici R3-111a-1]|uniref:Uncharacterized protein n=1 Tax=Gaeumannomyces tritici (strain R3-111a-1) TaxID=644352 RepID=J3P4N3_GAET3|nr:hypothetical protein GGTG_08470 [Gaeumannomyces tritici R3-111a-1]EJT74630.1 hypothetical protein GGTG_08470 [Gaeumannomyces tritici R3-111a-1]
MRRCPRRVKHPIHGYSGFWQMEVRVAVGTLIWRGFLWGKMWAGRGLIRKDLRVVRSISYRFQGSQTLMRWSKIHFLP